MEKYKGYKIAGTLKSILKDEPSEIYFVIGENDEILKKFSNYIDCITYINNK